MGATFIPGTVTAKGTVPINGQEVKSEFTLVEAGVNGGGQWLLKSIGASDNDLTASAKGPWYWSANIKVAQVTIGDFKWAFANATWAESGNLSEIAIFGTQQAISRWTRRHRRAYWAFCRDHPAFLFGRWLHQGLDLRDASDAWDGNGNEYGGGQHGGIAPGGGDRADIYRAASVPRVSVSISAKGAMELKCVITGDLNVFGVGDAGNEGEVRRKLEDLERQRVVPVRYRIGAHGADCRFHVSQGSRWVPLLVFFVLEVALAFSVFSRAKH